MGLLMVGRRRPPDNLARLPVGPAGSQISVPTCYEEWRARGDPLAECYDPIRPQ